MEMLMVADHTYLIRKALDRLFEQNPEQTLFGSLVYRNVPDGALCSAIQRYTELAKRQLGKDVCVMGNHIREELFDIFWVFEAKYGLGTGEMVMWRVIEAIATGTILPSFKCSESVIREAYRAYIALDMEYSFAASDCYECQKFAGYVREAEAALNDKDFQKLYLLYVTMRAGFFEYGGSDVRGNPKNVCPKEDVARWAKVYENVGKAMAGVADGCTQISYWADAVKYYASQMDCGLAKISQGTVDKWMERMTGPQYRSFPCMGYLLEHVSESKKMLASKCPAKIGD